jgi:AcrR family transcriptional regulator
MTTATAGPASTRRTGEELVLAVHAAALAEIAEHGLRGASMDGIARRAGTGKAALYRRWSNVRELGLDVFLTTMADSSPANYPDTGSLREDLLGSLRGFAGLLRGPLQMVLRELISESTHDPSLVAEFQARVGEPMQAQRIAMLQRAMGRGEIPTQPIDPLVFELPPAIVLHRLLLCGEVIDDETTVKLVDNVLLPLLGYRR